MSRKHFYSIAKGAIGTARKGWKEARQADIDRMSRGLGAVTLSHNWERDYERLSDNEFRSRMYQDAVKYYKTALGYPPVAGDPSDLQLKWEIAEVYYEQGKYGEAEKVYREILGIRESYITTEIPSEQKEDETLLFRPMPNDVDLQAILQLIGAIRQYQQNPNLKKEEVDQLLKGVKFSQVERTKEVLEKLILAREEYTAGRPKDALKILEDVGKREILSPVIHRAEMAIGDLYRADSSLNDPLQVLSEIPEEDSYYHQIAQVRIAQRFPKITPKQKNASVANAVVGWEQKEIEQLRVLKKELKGRGAQSDSLGERRGVCFVEMLKACGHFPAIPLKSNATWSVEKSWINNIKEAFKKEANVFARTFESQHIQMYKDLLGLITECDKNNNLYLRAACVECLQALNEALQPLKDEAVSIGISSAVSSQVKEKQPVEEELSPEFLSYRLAVLCAQAEVTAVKVEKAEAKSEEVLALYDQALQLDPQYAPALCGQVRTKFREKIFFEADAYAFIQKHPYTPALAEAYYYVGMRFYDAGKSPALVATTQTPAQQSAESYTDAYKEFLKISEKDYAQIPIPDAQILLSRGRVCSEAGHREECEACYKHLLQKPFLSAQLILDFIKDTVGVSDWKQRSQWHELALLVKDLSSKEKKEIALSYVLVMHDWDAAEHGVAINDSTMLERWKKIIECYQTYGLQDTRAKEVLYRGLTAKISQLFNQPVQALAFCNMAEHIWPQDNTRDAFDRGRGNGKLLQEEREALGRSLAQQARQASFPLMAKIVNILGVAAYVGLWGAIGTYVSAVGFGVVVTTLAATTWPIFAGCVAASLVLGAGFYGLLRKFNFKGEEVSSMFPGDRTFRITKIEPSTIWRASLSLSVFVAAALVVGALALSVNPFSLMALAVVAVGAAVGALVYAVCRWVSSKTDERAVEAAGKAAVAKSLSTDEKREGSEQRLHPEPAIGDVPVRPGVIGEPAQGVPASGKPASDDSPKTDTDTPDFTV